MNEKARKVVKGFCMFFHGMETAGDLYAAMGRLVSSTAYEVRTSPEVLKFVYRRATDFLSIADSYEYRMERAEKDVDNLIKEVLEPKTWPVHIRYPDGTCPKVADVEENPYEAPDWYKEFARERDADWLFGDDDYLEDTAEFTPDEPTPHEKGHCGDCVPGKCYF